MFAFTLEVEAQILQGQKITLKKILNTMRQY